jgi:hypothetical protein
VLVKHTAREEPTAETLFGAVCIYLIIGFSFARLYAIIAIMQPHALYLDPATYPHGVPKAFDFIYYSLGSMTTAGAAGFAAGLLNVHDRVHFWRCCISRS